MVDGRSEIQIREGKNIGSEKELKLFFGKIKTQSLTRGRKEPRYIVDCGKSYGHDSVKTFLKEMLSFQNGNEVKIPSVVENVNWMLDVFLT